MVRPLAFGFIVAALGLIPSGLTYAQSVSGGQTPVSNIVFVGIPEGEVKGASTSADEQCVAPQHTLRRGARNGDVSTLQSFLVSQGLLTEDSATGFFGRLTEAAVQLFQSQNGIVSGGSAQTTGYGAVGQRTLAAIRAQCSANVNKQSDASGSVSEDPSASNTQSPADIYDSWYANSLNSAALSNDSNGGGSGGSDASVSDTVDTLSYVMSQHPDKTLISYNDADGSQNFSWGQYVDSATSRIFRLKFTSHTAASWLGYTWDNNFIYFTEDQSPGDPLTDSWNPPAYMFKRTERVGERLNQIQNGVQSVLTVYNRPCGSVSSSAPYTGSYFVLEAHYPRYDLGGDLGVQDVIVLREEEGSVSEKEWYAKGWGLVRWQQCTTDGSSCDLSVTMKKIVNQAPPKPDTTLACTALMKEPLSTAAVQPQAACTITPPSGTVTAGSPYNFAYTTTGNATAGSVYANYPTTVSGFASFAPQTSGTIPITFSAPGTYAVRFDVNNNYSTGNTVYNTCTAVVTVNAAPTTKQLTSNSSNTTNSSNTQNSTNTSNTTNTTNTVVSNCSNGLTVSAYPSCACPAGQSVSGGSCVSNTPASTPQAACVVSASSVATAGVPTAVSYSTTNSATAATAYQDFPTLVPGKGGFAPGSSGSFDVTFTTPGTHIVRLDVNNNASTGNSGYGSCTTSIVVSAPAPAAQASCTLGASSVATVGSPTMVSYTTSGGASAASAYQDFPTPVPGKASFTPGSSGSFDVTFTSAGSHVVRMDVNNNAATGNTGYASCTTSIVANGPISAADPRTAQLASALEALESELDQLIELLSR